MFSPCFCYVVLSDLSSFAIILMRNRELVALLLVFCGSSSRCRGESSSLCRGVSSSRCRGVVTVFPGNMYSLIFSNAQLIRLWDVKSLTTSKCKRMLRTRDNNCWHFKIITRHRSYKTFSMLNSAEHEIYPAHKY